MEVAQDNFYIGLFSNGSLKIYPENTLSAFTNLLRSPYILNENWSVGLTEIAFNNYKSSSIKQEINPNRESSGEECTNVLPRIKKRKRKRNINYVYSKPIKTKKRSSNVSNLKEINIKLNYGDYKIVLTNEMLKKYEFKKGHINFAKFLEMLPQHIVPIPDNNYPYELTKYTILDNIKIVDWNNQPYVEYKRESDEFTLHLYLESFKSYKIILKYKNYTNIMDFLTEIITQIPIDMRVQSKLLNIFNIFYSKVDLIFDDDTQYKNIYPIHNLLIIKFKEYGAQVVIEANKLQKLINFIDLISLFHENIKFDINNNGKELNEKKKAALKKLINNSIIDVFRGNDFEGEEWTKNRKINDVILRIPLLHGQHNESRDTILEIKKYDRIDHFLNEIYNQIPKFYRDKKSFLKYITDSLETNEEDNDEINSLNQTEPIVLKNGLDQNKKQSEYSYNISAANRPKKTQQEPINQEPTQQLPSEQTESVSDKETSVAQPTIDDQTKTNDNKFDDTIVGFYKHIIFKHNKHEKISDIYHFIYVYTDIIKPRAIADQQIRYLRIIPILKVHEQRHIKFGNVEYCPIEKTFIENISILITDNSGNKINFDSSTYPTFVMLHFKKNK